MLDKLSTIVQIDLTTLMMGAINGSKLGDVIYFEDMAKCMESQLRGFYPQ